MEKDLSHEILGSILNAYKIINEQQFEIDYEYADLERIKDQLKYVLIFPLTHAILCLIGANTQEEVNTLEKSLTTFIDEFKSDDPEKFLEYINLILRRNEKNKPNN